MTVEVWQLVAESFVLGVDGGTTKTIALVADMEGHILGAGRSGNSNYSGADVEKPMAVVLAAVRDAMAQATVSGDQIALASFCLAGADWPEDHTRRHDFLQAAGVARKVIVRNDSFAGLRAGMRRTFGVGIAAGTGTNTCVIAPDGQEWAFGYYAGQGGAGDVASEAVRAVLRAEDGRGKPTALTKIVLDRLGYSHPDMLLRGLVANEVDRGKILSLCPLVFEAAYDGDEVAADIVVHQGQTLAEYAVAAIRRFHMERLEFDLVLSGSVFKGKGPLLMDTIAQIVHRLAPSVHVIRPQVEPAVGAVLLAYDGLGLPVTEAMYDNLAATMPDHSFFDTADGGKFAPRPFFGGRAPGR